MKLETASRPSYVQKTGDRIELVFQQAGEDHAAWWLFIWNKSIARSSQTVGAKLGRLLILVVLCVIAILFFFVLVLGWLAFWNQNKNLLPFISGASILSILFIVLQRGIGPKSYSRSLARRAAIRQFRLQAKGIKPRWQRIILSPDEVIEMYLDLRGKLEWIIDWKAFDSIELGEKHAFFITQIGAELTVPQRAFPDERAFLDFIETAWAFHRRSRESVSGVEPVNASAVQEKPVEERITTEVDGRNVT